MDVTAELTRLSGLQQLQAIFAGKTGYAGIVKTLDLHPVSAEEGFVVFEGSTILPIASHLRQRNLSRESAGVSGPAGWRSSSAWEDPGAARLRAALR